MSFDADKIALLAAPLSRANVRSRKQGGRDVSYIEGWRVIDEANRIFGFDGWTRETVDVKCVAEKDRAIGDSKAPGFGVSYTAKVRITAGGIIRDGIGAGHGIDRDLGQAHESAIKEAETDAMKRALMTFGNPFGLALYDKEQANVQDEVTPDWSIPFMKSCKAEIKAFKGETELRTWWASEKQRNARRDADLSKEQVAELVEDVGSQIKEIQKAQAA
jgi:DNA recombination protein Rad52